MAHECKKLVYASSLESTHAFCQPHVSGAGRGCGGRGIYSTSPRDANSIHPPHDTEWQVSLFKPGQKVCRLERVLHVWI